MDITMAPKEDDLKKALIGYTGFIGGNLLRQTKFDFLYNRSNIIDLQNNDLGLVVCAAPSAEKWRANLEPEKDLEAIDELIRSIKKINTAHFILISTIDVYKNPRNFNEDSRIEIDGLHPYGRNRYLLEDFVDDNFTNHLIVRLPALFGYGLKKNFIFDLLHSNCLEMTDCDSEFQFYGLSHLWDDINFAINKSINKINITSEPISARELALRCFNIDFKNKTVKPPIKYDIRSKYDFLFGGKNGYMYEKHIIVNEIKNFVNSTLQE
jgi:hypothetical protein